MNVRTVRSIGTVRARRRATAFDPHFSTRHPLFWPLERAACALGRFDDFPPIEALGAVFEGEPPVRFVAEAPRPRRARRGGGGVDVRRLYDARIVLDGEVPTRPRSWHDLMNALVWGTFPRAKRALHARQYRAIAARVAPGSRTLPGSRTPELDALALLDEGGLVIWGGAEGSEGTRVVFGHAIYESFVLGVAPAVVAALEVAPDRAPGDVLRETDGALAAKLEDCAALLGPRELTRVRLTAVSGPPAGAP